MGQDQCSVQLVAYSSVVQKRVVNSAINAETCQLVDVVEASDLLRALRMFDGLRNCTRGVTTALHDWSVRAGPRPLRAMHARFFLPPPLPLASPPLPPPPPHPPTPLHPTPPSPTPFPFSLFPRSHLHQAPTLNHAHSTQDSVVHADRGARSTCKRGHRQCRCAAACNADGRTQSGRCRKVNQARKLATKVNHRVPRLPCSTKLELSRDSLTRCTGRTRGCSGCRGGLCLRDS